MDLCSAWLAGWLEFDVEILLLAAGFQRKLNFHSAW